jgi:hypothetical protein
MIEYHDRHVALSLVNAGMPFPARQPYVETL